MAEDIKGEILKFNEDLKGIMKDYQNMGESFKTTQGQVNDLAGQITEMKNALSEIQMAQVKGMQVGCGAKDISPEFKSMLDHICNKGAGTVSVAGNGGYLSAPEFVERVVQKLQDIDPIRQYAEIINVSGNIAQIPYEINSATTHWVGETEDRSGKQDVGTFGLAQIPVNELIARCPVSDILLHDSRIPLEQYLINTVTMQINKAVGGAFCTGNGFKKPLGFFVDDTVPTKKAGSTSTVTPDNLYDLWAELPTSADANSRYYMSKGTMGVVAKAKGNDNYYWQPSVGQGLPATFNGFPVIACPSAPAIASASHSVVFGDLYSAYKIVQSVDMTYKKDETSGADDGMTILRFGSRVGGQTVMASSIIALVNSV